MAGARIGGVPLGLLAIAWFVAVTVPILLFVNVSGAHFNPTISVALSMSSRFPKNEVAPYIVAQVAGAFLGSAVVLATLGNYADLGATVPRTGDFALVFGGEFLFSFLLVLAVFALVELGRGGGSWRLLWPGFVVAVSTYVIGPISLSSLNLARSLAPAVLSWTFYGLWVYFLAVPLGSLATLPVVLLVLRPLVRARQPASTEASR